MTANAIIRACGCVPYRRNEQGKAELLMVCNSYEEDHWEFPKGKQEKGETDEETALRELKEETGLTGKLIDASIPEFSYIQRIDGVPHTKTVRYFMCEIAPDVPVQMNEEELSGCAWLTPEECVERATFKDMRTIVVGEM